jgi:EAL domain-containing protein (putative c-di-GMP-specific phosphodiesterase class I)
MHRRTVKLLRLETDLRRALDRGEFVLHYQPRVCLQDDRLLGVEALIRWQHPRRGLLSPGDFIPLAELTGVIDPLSRWVVEHACEQGRRWLAEGLPRFQIAVNLSARQFRERQLPALIEAARGNGDQPHLALEVELTESMVMQNPAQALEVMRELKRLGVQMAIDDFGTGYSSLAQLRHFPIDCLKIDKSFVERLPGDTEDRAIIQAIVALGQSLHLRLVAEGVETPEQHQYLARMGCHEGQGYLFGRPMSAAALVEWLADREVVSPDSR